MKILHLLYESDGDYFGIGGVGVRAYKIYERLCDRHDITLLCKKYPGAIDGVKKGLGHIHVGKETENFTLTLLSYACAARRYVFEKGEAYDVIVEEFSPAVPTFLNTFRKRPVLLQVQGYTGLQYLLKYNPFYSVPLYLLEKARPYFYKNYVFVSEATKKRFRIRRNSTVKIIPNGVDLVEVKKSDLKKRYILYLGRLDVHNKGLDILIEGFKKLVKNNNSVPNLVIAGDGRDRDRFYSLLKELPSVVSERIELAGWVEGEQKSFLLQNAELLVMPSRYESHPIVAMEAASSGIPIVASDIGELRFIGENRMGFNFRTADPIAMVQRINEILNNKILRDEFGENARRWAEGYSWDRISEEYENYLEEVAGG